MQCITLFYYIWRYFVIYDVILIHDVILWYMTLFCDTWRYFVIYDVILRVWRCSTLCFIVWSAYNECIEKENVCGTNAYCLVDRLSYACQCKDTYTLSKNQCTKGISSYFIQFFRRETSVSQRPVMKSLFVTYKFKVYRVCSKLTLLSIRLTFLLLLCILNVIAAQIMSHTALNLQNRHRNNYLCIW